MYVAKGEPKCKPMFEIPIREAMIRREIKESDAYVNYLAKYPHAQSGTPTPRKGQGKGYMHKGDMEVNKPKKKKDAVKLKAKEQASHDTQLLLNLKKQTKESKKQRNLKEIRKAPRDGSGVAPDSLDHNESTDSKDDDSDKDSDDDEDQAVDFVIRPHDKEQEQTQP
ncbi:hypothetical protein Tco_0857336 [Tanacetum coccineum]|uniref:Uncharacterized protein n=1 Tax=Tanacetum coccineum TaxID=301880 RepID=A0ABQ5B7T9_9ASTR